jgi:hypothetical protein
MSDEPDVVVLETPLIDERNTPAVLGDGAMLCAAADICVNTPSTVSDSDLVCPMCNKIAHAICIIASNDEKEGCMTACYVDEEL